MPASHPRLVAAFGQSDPNALSWSGLFRRVAQAPGGLPALIDMRARLLRALPTYPAWASVEQDLAELLRSLLTPESLELRRIAEDTPAAILDAIVRYEAVHAIADRAALARRLQRDRRCFGLFHPSMPDEPLIFTELALTGEMSASVQPILDPASPIIDPSPCTCAMFYSISSCHEGLRGIAFGNLLIRRVVDLLQVEFPGLQTFATVSPVPGFRGWLAGLVRDNGDKLTELRALIGEADSLAWNDDGARAKALEEPLLALGAFYLMRVKRGDEPADAVARFHLGNGARLERVNWRGDTSAAGVARGFGLTANYVYRLSEIDVNLQAYASAHTVVVSDVVRSLADDAAWFSETKSTSTFIPPSVRSR